MTTSQKLYQQALEWHRLGDAIGIVTLVEVVGSSPAPQGARMVVDRQGMRAGTVGGGKVEAYALAEAAAGWQKRHTHRFVRVNLQTDLGMSCGGVVGLYFEWLPNRHPFAISLFGAGHVAQELVHLLQRLDCQLDCYDHRQEWLQRLPSADHINPHLVDDYEKAAAALEGQRMVLSITQGHARDLEVLSGLARSNLQPRFLGVIGSATKAKRLRRELQRRGIELGFHCPVGLDFGGNQPVEIALSIVGQLLQVRDSSSVN